MKLVAALAALGAVFIAAGCGSGTPKRVPSVTGVSLDAAEGSLDATDLRYSIVGGGTFGVLIRSRWQVCRQLPRPGAVSAKVTLFVARSCDAAPAPQQAVVPDVEYLALDDAEEQLSAAGLGWKVEADDPIVIRSNWEVCDQSPEPGEWGTSVELDVDHSCDGWG